MDFAVFQDSAALVTGGAGFIGSHLVESLLEHGARVRVLDSFSTGRPENLDHVRARVELLEGDIRDAETCRGACEGVHLVFHQAALGSVPRSLEDPVTTHDVNVIGTVQILDAARAAGVRRVVFASSSSVYGDSPTLPKREGEEGRPLSPYAATKQSCELVARCFQAAYGLETIGLRYFNVYGPRQDPEGPYAAVIPRFIEALRGRRAPIIYGDGQQTRDFTYVSDAVLANLLAATADVGATGSSYNVATGTPTSVLELARGLAAILQRDIPPEHQAPRAGDVRHSTADLNGSRQSLGYRPRFTLAQGLGATAAVAREIPAAQEVSSRR